MGVNLKKSGFCGVFWDEKYLQIYPIELLEPPCSTHISDCLQNALEGCLQSTIESETVGKVPHCAFKHAKDK